MSEPASFIKAEAARLCGVSAGEIEDDANLLSFGMDSVRAMDLVIAIEDRYGIEMDDERAASLRTVRDIADYTTELLG